MSQEEQEQQEEPHQNFFQTHNIFWPKMNFNENDLWRIKRTTGFLNCLAQRFYFNWSLTLKTKSCIIFFSFVFIFQVIFICKSSCTGLLLFTKQNWTFQTKPWTPNLPTQTRQKPKQQIQRFQTIPTEATKYPVKVWQI